MARLYANENFPLQVVAALREMGHDVLSVAESGNANQSIPDEAVLTFATRDGRAVLTLNRRDFIRLHNRQPNHSGIIVCAQDPDIEQQARRIHAAIEQARSLTRTLIRVNLPNR